MKKLVFLAMAAQLAVAAPSVKRAGSANNDFGFQLFNQVQKRTEKGNKFLSPVSAYLALSMLYDGARGISEKEMSEGLFLSGLTREDVGAMNHEFMHALTGSKDYTLKIANSAWTRKGFDLLDAFSENLGNYHARAASLDFSQKSAVDTINKWVAEATFDKVTKKALIDKILEEIPADAVLYLLNAVYFNADWEQKFKDGDSWNREFHVTAKRTVQVPTMSQTGRYRVVGNDSRKAIELPYKGGKTSMVVILPEGKETVDSLAAKLTDKSWAALTASLDKAEPATYDITLPKLELKYEDELNDALTKQKMGSLFNKGAPADLTGISDAAGHLYVSKVKQKTFLQVDEDGTKAAAVTSVEVGLESAILVQNRFEVDRPYLLAIRDKGTNAVLFLGAINEPEGGKLKQRK